MEINPYLTFKGNCEEAFTFYHAVLGGNLVGPQRFADVNMTEGLPEGWGDKVMHVLLEVDGEKLMGSDAPPEHFVNPPGFSVSVNVDTTDEAERIFAALAEGGEVTMPLAETFWAKRFGMLSDRFGVPWMVNCE